MIRIDQKGARLVALFILGALLMNYPLLTLFNRTRLIFGIPALYLYLFVSWAALIAMVGLASQLSSVLKIDIQKEVDEK